MSKKDEAQYRLLSPWGYFVYQLLFSIPIIGFIFLIIYALDDTNLNRRNYARSFFCSLIVAIGIIILVFLFAIIIGFGLPGMTDSVNNLINA